MSVASLSRNLESVHVEVLDKIYDAIESHGLDPDSSEVLNLVEDWFGPGIRESLEDWMS